MHQSFGTIIEIGNVLVSEDVVCEYFACDYEVCGGACCIEGDSGAPLEESELEGLEDGYPSYSPLMSAEGRARVDKVGFFEVDREGDLVTPCVPGSCECAFCRLAVGSAAGGAVLAAVGLASAAGGPASAAGGPASAAGAAGVAEVSVTAGDSSFAAGDSSLAAGLSGTAGKKFGERPAGPEPRQADGMPEPSSVPENQRPVSALCAIEMAGLEKPVSCALYPIRITIRLTRRAAAKGCGSTSSCAGRSSAASGPTSTTPSAPPPGTWMFLRTDLSLPLPCAKPPLSAHRSHLLTPPVCKTTPFCTPQASPAPSRVQNTLFLHTAARYSQIVE